MRPGRNDLCPCGSGQKYKKCCQTSEGLAARTRQALHNRLAQPLPADPKILDYLHQQGVDPAYIHAYRETGILVFQETLPLLDEEQRARWQSAYEGFTPN